MKAAQDQLALAGVGVDVADGEDAGLAGLELLGVDHQLLALQRQLPVGDGAELGAHAVEDEQRVQRQRRRAAVRPQHLDGRHAAVLLRDAVDLADDEAHAPGITQLAHARHAGGRGLKAVAPVQQRDAGS